MVTDAAAGAAFHFYKVFRKLRFCHTRIFVPLLYCKKNGIAIYADIYRY